MRRRLLGSLLAGTLLVSCIPAAEAAGPFGRTLIGRRLILPIGLPLPPPPPGGGGGGGGTGGGGGGGGGGDINGDLLGRSTTVTTTTTTANLNIISNPDTRGVAGSVVYQTVKVSTTIMGFTYTTSTSTLSGNISRTPTVDNNTVNFVLYYAGVGSAHNLASCILDSAGNGSFTLSTLNGAALPLILEGDVVYANARISGQFVTLKIGQFGPATTSSTSYAP